MTQPDRSLTDILEPLDRLPDVRVLVVGDVMLDRYAYGDVNRISPEAPVPVLNITRETAMLGSAGNVLANLHGLDVRTSIVSIVGDDAPGRIVRAMAMAKGADALDLIVAGDRPTTVKSRFVAANQQMMRADSELGHPIDGALEDAIIRRATAAMQGAGAVIVSDYNKGVITPNVVRGVIRAAREAGIPVCVDPKKTDGAVYRDADVLKPNRKELAELSGMDVATDDDVVRAARFLIDTHAVGAVVATRSQDGMSIVTRDAPAIHLRTEAVEVFDVSGAGDTVIATMAALLAAGADLVAACVAANAAGGIVVAKIGTAAIHRQELRDAMLHRELTMRRPGGHTVIDRMREAPVLSVGEAAEQVRRWQARGLKVGWTNGCFDILHAGHAGYLNRARDLCDRLVVGMNADASVRRLKGPMRPVNDEAGRATLLAALGAVDLVVPFGDDPAEDDKPLRAVAALQPDILFKGGDYREEQLPEAAIVRAYGGEVRIMPLYEGHSTTAIIRRAQTGG